MRARSVWGGEPSAAVVLVHIAALTRARRVQSFCHWSWQSVSLSCVSTAVCSCCLTASSYRACNSMSVCKHAYHVQQLSSLTMLLNSQTDDLQCACFIVSRTNCPSHSQAQAVHITFASTARDWPTIDSRMLMASTAHHWTSSICRACSSHHLTCLQVSLIHGPRAACMHDRHALLTNAVKHICYDAVMMIQQD